MTDYIYYLECHHVQVHKRPVKTKQTAYGESRWCPTCRAYKDVAKLVIKKYVQKKLRGVRRNELKVSTST